jgi:quercetin dioxygenase-like cupin family protein
MRQAVRTRQVIVLCAVLALGIGAGALLARTPEAAPKVQAQELFVEDFAGDPSKEVKAQIYDFPPGASVPWHIHPDAHEIAYVIAGTFTFQRAGQPPKIIEAGHSEYLAPNVVHRGMNEGSQPVKLFVVRIKPKDKPLTTEVPAPQ